MTIRLCMAYTRWTSDRNTIRSTRPDALIVVGAESHKTALWPKPANLITGQMLGSLDRQRPLLLADH